MREAATSRAVFGFFSSLLLASLLRRSGHELLGAGASPELNRVSVWTAGLKGCVGEAENHIQIQERAQFYRLRTASYCHVRPLYIIVLSRQSRP
jgi:hypothetical protein